MGEKPSYTMHGEFRMPMGFPVEGFSSALEYRARPADIFVAAYPKCGTTWVQYIVYLLLHQGVPLPGDRLLGETIPHLEEVGRGPVERLPEPRAIKTHLPFDMTPAHPKSRYIYVARNPFDCVVSFYHHTRGFAQHYDFSAGTFEDYFECFLAGEVDFGDYFDNLASWYEHRDDPNVHFLTYEALKADVRSAVVAIAEFLELPCGGDEATLDEVVHHSSLANMRQGQGRWSSRRPDDSPAFIRKGVVGDWLNHFSPDQAHRLADKFRVSAETSGFGRLWPDIIQAARLMS